jgi:hypothetical protein
MNTCNKCDHYEGTACLSLGDNTPSQINNPTRFSCIYFTPKDITTEQLIGKIVNHVMQDVCNELATIIENAVRETLTEHTGIHTTSNG